MTGYAGIGVHPCLSHELCKLLVGSCPHASCFLSYWKAVICLSNTLQNDIPDEKKKSKHTDSTATLDSSVLILLWQASIKQYWYIQNILSYILIDCMKNKIHIPQKKKFPILTSQPNAHKIPFNNPLHIFFKQLLCKTIVFLKQISSSVQHRSSTSSATSFKSMPFSSAWESHDGWGHGGKYGIFTYMNGWFLW